MQLNQYPASFQKKVRVVPNPQLDTPCWFWTASPTIGKGGVRYGQYYHEGKIKRAHRYAYETAHGRMIQQGHHIHHTCSEKLCCNPAHLVEVDPKTHAQIEAAQGTFGDLTPDDVDQIRRRYARDPRPETLRALGREYGKHFEHIRKVAKGLSYARLPRIASIEPAILDLSEGF